MRPSATDCDTTKNTSSRPKTPLDDAYRTLYSLARERYAPLSVKTVRVVAQGNSAKIGMQKSDVGKIAHVAVYAPNLYTDFEQFS